MREILFRGKIANNKDWVYGGVIPLDTDSGYVFIAEPFLSASTLPVYEIIKHHTHLVIPDTVGQYIGVEDKNGKKVFEGDILRYTPRPKCTIYYKVIWNQEWSRFALVQWSTHKYHLYEWAEFSKVKYSCEVIGNIHDNPDLLESLESN